MAAGIALPLLDFRFVRNFLGDASCDFWASCPGSSDVAPPATPILSFAVLTIAGAFDRQLPPPPSHFRLAFLFSVCVLEAAGVPLVAESGSTIDAFEATFLDVSTLLAVLGGGFEGLASVEGTGSVLPSSAGACGLGFVFLRGLIPTWKVRGSSSLDRS